MGEWVTGAAINILGSISINFGTNLLKLGHNQVNMPHSLTYSIRQTAQLRASYKCHVKLHSYALRINVMSHELSAFRVVRIRCRGKLRNTESVRVYESYSLDQLF